MSAQLPLRPLGNTGLVVSALALGTVKFGRTAGLKYSKDFELPSDTELRELLRSARSLGINLLDTAPAYGTSEARLGQLLGAQREDWLLCSKVGERFSEHGSSYDFRAESVAPSIEASLRRLNTDYLDIALIHSNGNELQILEQDRTLDALLELKHAGLVRAVGISHKTLVGGRRALALGADVLMTELNSKQRDMAPLIAECAAQNVGVLIKKALGSGHAGANSLAYVAGCEGVTSIVVGTINQAHLEENARIVCTALGATRP